MIFSNRILGFLAMAAAMVVVFPAGAEACVNEGPAFLEPVAPTRARSEVGESAPEPGARRQDVESPVSQEAIDQAIDRGLEYLVREQELDGSWRFHVANDEGGITGLCVYTLIKGGLPKDHFAVLRGLTYLDSVQPARTYEVAAMIMAYASIKGGAYEQRIQELTDLLVKWNKGTWAYPGSHQDMSNTHFGALALRHARSAGADVPDKVWIKIGETLPRWQDEEGGFPYVLTGKPTLSMTAAGVGVACLVREALAQVKRKPSALDGEMEEIIVRGQAWLDRQDPVPQIPWQGNAPHRRWDYYYLYALQRIGVLIPTEIIAGEEWYPGGAKWLIKKQLENGRWGSANGEPQPNTCFAILFLVRASAPRTGEVVSKKKVLRIEDPQADLTLVITDGNPARMWIEAVHELVPLSFEWPGEEGKGLRVAKVEYLRGDEVLATVLGDPTRPDKTNRYAAEVPFDRSGEHAIFARMTLAPHPEEPDEIPIVESPELLVTVAQGMEAWMLEYGQDLARNLMPDSGNKVEASSAFKAWGPRLAFDRVMGLGWLCAEGDTDPWISIEFKKPVKLNTLLLTHANQGPQKPGKYSLAQKVEVSINKQKPFVAELEPNEQRKSIIPLARDSRVRFIKLRLLDLQTPEGAAATTGLMEVELQLR